MRLMKMKKHHWQNILNVSNMYTVKSYIKEAQVVCVVILPS